MLARCLGAEGVVDRAGWAHGAAGRSDSSESVSKGSRRSGPGAYVGFSLSRLRASTARLWATIADQT